MSDLTVVDDGAILGRLRLNTALVRGSEAVGPCVVSVYHRSSQGRRQAEIYIETAYARAFDGRIGRHFPMIMTVEDRSRNILAAAGFRLAGDHTPYLERYLDEPVETAVSRALGVPTLRNRIAEIGNLAAHGRGASLFLFLALASRLKGLGCTHAVATATHPLRRIFAKVGFATRRLAPARAERLGAEADSWGAYYDADPEVVAGAIAAALPALSRILQADPAMTPVNLQ